MSYCFSKIIFTLVGLILLMPANAFSQIKLPDENKPIAPTAAYSIHQGDKLSVKFFYQPELNETSLTVRPDGYISLQLIDDVKAEGLTTRQLKARLEKAYNEILLEPLISVALVEFVAPRVFVGGQVGKPGRYDLRDGQTLVQVIFLAGGFNRDANRGTVLHARPDGKGDWKITPVNVSKILSQKGAEKDVFLSDGDYVFVPDSKISRINKAVETFRGLLPRFF
ncbi:MAG: polysaccharide export protein [Pyrinomonadaceae bacterium]|nr:polysaccharide export protein [Pyrinomonadaceae bacterium]